jgi:ketopantoate reductase
MNGYGHLHAHDPHCPFLIPFPSLFKGYQSSSACADAFGVISYSRNNEIAEQISFPLISDASI